jgi:hypothetical protein
MNDELLTPVLELLVVRNTSTAWATGAISAANTMTGTAHKRGRSFTTIFETAALPRELPGCLCCDRAVDTNC